MPQSSRTKELMRRASRNQNCVFPFDNHRPLIGFLDKHTPDDARVVLFGGWKGYVASLMERRNREFLSIDMVPVQGFVPTMEMDLEVAMDDATIRGIRNGRPKVSVITAISIEYMDIGLVRQNIARLLQQGERWLWICTHSGSTGFREFRIGVELLEIIRAVRQKLRQADCDMIAIAAEVDDKILKAYGTMISGILTDMEKCGPLARMALLQEPLSRTAFGIAIQLSNCLHVYAMMHGKKDQLDQILRCFEEMQRSDTELGEMMLQNPISSHNQLRVAAGDGFELVHPARYEKGDLKLLLGVFEKR